MTQVQRYVSFAPIVLLESIVNWVSSTIPPPRVSPVRLDLYNVGPRSDSRAAAAGAASQLAISRTRIPSSILVIG